MSKSLAQHLEERKHVLGHFNDSLKHILPSKEKVCESQLAAPTGNAFSPNWPTQPCHTDLSLRHALIHPMGGSVVKTDTINFNETKGCESIIMIDQDSSPRQQDDKATRICL